MKLPYSIFNRDRYSKLRNAQAVENDVTTVSDNVNTLDSKIDTASDLLNVIDAYLGEEFMRDQTDAYITFNAGQKTRSVSADISRDGYTAVGIIRIIAENTSFVLRGFGIKTDGVTAEGQYYNMTDLSEAVTSKVAFHVIYRKNK